MLNFNTLTMILIWTIPVLFAITLHEVSHGWLANKLGDPTARMAGRLTINPIKHIDLVGTIIVPIVMLVLSHNQFIFGWAKPVPVNWNNLRNPRRDVALVAAAGPISNLLMALAWGFIARMALDLGSASSANIVLPIAAMGAAGIMINGALMILNLIPIPPLDGSRVLSSFLPPKLAWHYNRLAPYGFFILIILLVSGALAFIMLKPFIWFIFLLKSLYNLPLAIFRF